jgi:hypothetical protein
MGTKQMQGHARLIVQSRGCFREVIQENLDRLDVLWVISNIRYIHVRHRRNDALIACYMQWRIASGISLTGSIFMT